MRLRRRRRRRMRGRWRSMHDIHTYMTRHVMRFALFITRITLLSMLLCVRSGASARAWCLRNSSTTCVPMLPRHPSFRTPVPFAIRLQINTETCGPPRPQPIVCMMLC